MLFVDVIHRPARVHVRVDHMRVGPRIVRIGREVAVEDEAVEQHAGNHVDEAPGVERADRGRAELVVRPERACDLGRTELLAVADRARPQADLGCVMTAAVLHTTWPVSASTK